MKSKKHPIDLNENRNRKLPACSAVLRLVYFVKELMPTCKAEQLFRRYFTSYRRYIFREERERTERLLGLHDGAAKEGR